MKRLGDLIDGELPRIEHRQIELHIDECYQCGREAEFLRSLSYQAASLPKSIQPDTDLWPGIEAEIAAGHLPEIEWCASEDTNAEPKHNRPKATVWGWRIAATAVLGSFVLAGTYLVIREQTARHSNQGVTSNAADRQPSEFAQPPSTRSLEGGRGASAEHKTGPTARSGMRTLNIQPLASILTYLLDPDTMLSVSNYGVYSVRLEFDTSLGITSNYIVRFDKNGVQSWPSPLPPGSMPLSIYAGGGNRLWISYVVQQPESQTLIAELNFGAESQVREIWKSGDLRIQKFVMGPQGFIYAAGTLNEFSKAVPKLTKGQSITAELVHIIDPATGEERHLFPITIRPRFDTPYWAGQTMLDMIALIPAIAVKSNGNFFVAIDRTRIASDRDLIRNDVVEYSPDGTEARTWKLGTLEPNAYLNRIFVDVDDSILVEILRYPDGGAANAATIVDRYLLRVDLDGRVTRYRPTFPLDEVIQGWVGRTQDLVTLVPGRQPVMRIHRLTP
jgi:hypothetical protein